MRRSIKDRKMAQYLYEYDPAQNNQIVLGLLNTALDLLVDGYDKHAQDRIIQAIKELEGRDEIK